MQFDYHNIMHLMSIAKRLLRQKNFMHKRKSVWNGVLILEGESKLASFERDSLENLLTYKTVFRSGIECHIPCSNVQEYPLQEVEP